MDVWDFPFALLGFLGFVAFMPAWMFFVYRYEPAVLTAESHFLAQLVLPAAVILFIVGWVQR